AQRVMRKSYPSVEGFDNYPVWSGGQGEWKNLSPFFLGPSHIDGLVANNLELAWQFSKVYADHVGPDGKPNAAWYAWRKEGFSSPKAIRHPRSEKPLYSYINGKALQAVEARKELYIPL